MPWCPKCRNEYKPGYTICADCGCELVVELQEEMTVAYFGSEKEIESIVEFLKANNIDGIESRHNEEDNQYELWVTEKDSDSVKLALRTYFKKILPQMMAENDSCDTECDVINEKPELAHNENTYVKPSDRAVEYKSGAATLLLVGIVGAVVLVLADFGIINFPMYGAGKILINVVLGGMFLAFVILGINSISSYKKLKEKASMDEKAEEDILNWFEENVTKEDITSFDNDDESEEALYFGRIAFIKKQISDNFPEKDVSFIDYIAEKLYAKTFE